MKRRINRLLVGAPGIGKTETVLSSYDHVEVLLLSSSVEEDIYGLPYRDGENEKRTIPPFLVRLRNADEMGKTTCLFLDELDKARKEVADTLLTLVASRKTPYGLELPEKTEIIAAANPPEFGGGDGISIPMLNRFSVKEFNVSPAKWAEWARKKFPALEIQQLINLFEIGELPLLDSSGDGLTLKIASPRSIAYAFSSIQQFLNGDISFDEAQDDICGLLPPSVAGRVAKSIEPDSLDTGLFVKAGRVVRKANTVFSRKGGPYVGKN